MRFTSRPRPQPRDAERVLLSHAHRWLHRIPSSLHPKRLCRQRPELANRLAEAWADTARRDRLLCELIAGSDPGGLLAPALHAEVLTLQRYAQQRIQIVYPPLNARGRQQRVFIDLLPAAA